MVMRLLQCAGQRGRGAESSHSFFRALGLRKAELVMTVEVWSSDD